MGARTESGQRPFCAGVWRRLGHAGKCGGCCLWCALASTGVFEHTPHLHTSPGEQASVREVRETDLVACVLCPDEGAVVDHVVRDDGHGREG